VSNHLAIATVTAALGQLVHTAAQSAVAGVALRFGRPTAQTSTEKKVHIYLYQVSANAALRNNDLPTRNSEGTLTTRPQAALDLHYLLTFYGDDQALEPDRMLGAVVRNLHARSVLSGAVIQNAIASHSAELGGSNLESAPERVKFTPLPLSLEELSKLWSVFLQTPHALSVAYQGTVVLIEADESPSPVLPVLQRGKGDRGVETVLGPFPHLAAVHIGPVAAAGIRPRPPSYPNAELGLQLTFTGENLAGDVVTLRFTHPHPPAVEQTMPAGDRSATELRLELPDDAPAQSEWAAGIYTVVVDVDRGGTKHRSDAFALALAPHVIAIQPKPAPRDGAGSVTLTVTCRPQVKQAQSAVLLLGDREVVAESLGAASDSLTFVIPNAPVAQDILAQVRVDGVGSMPFKFDDASRTFVFDDDQRVTIQ
jgi:hypothetical protein